MFRPSDCILPLVWASISSFIRSGTELMKRNIDIMRSYEAFFVQKVRDFIAMYIGMARNPLDRDTRFFL